MKKLPRVLLLMVGIILVNIDMIPSLTSAIAQEREGCFLVDSSGKVVNLNSLCGSSSTQTPTVNSKPGVFEAKIKRREYGVPVIDVNFVNSNNSQQFEMLVDTGASHILITDKMAKTLSVAPTGKALVDTASAKGVEISTGTVDAVEVNGLVVNKIPVGIAGPDVDIGLLGQSFYAGYDLKITEDTVEFQLRQPK